MKTRPFVGRGKEQLILHEQRLLAEKNGCSLLLISGPAGIGKTALARHFLRSAENDWIWTEGRGWDNRAAVPYQALREAALRLPRPPALFSPETGHPLCPYLEVFLNGQGSKEIGSVPPELLFRSLGSLLTECAHPGLCLFLDDLQWADEGTFEWLDYALRELTQTPLLLIGACRSEERESIRPLLEHCSRLAREDRFSEWELKPLNRHEVDELTHTSIPQSDGEVSHRVWSRSEGVALLAVEEIRVFLEGKNGFAEGQLLIEGRLERFSLKDKELLDQAAVIGESFSAEILAAAVGRDLLEVAQRLDGLMGDTGVLIAEEEGYRFAHSRYREALLEPMSPTRRKLLHQKLVTYADTLLPAERTYHLVHAGQTEEGIEALMRQGDYSLEMLDWRDALRYYQDALCLSWEDSTLTRRARYEIYERIGDLHLWTVHQPDIARGYYEAALTWATSAQEKVSLLCRLVETYRNSTKAIQHIEDATRLVAQVQDTTLRSWVELLQVEKKPLSTLSGRQHIYQLSGQLLQNGNLPAGLLRRCLQEHMVIAGENGDIRAIRHHLSALQNLPAHSWSAATYHLAIGAVFSHNTEGLQNGLNQAKKHFEQAQKVFESLGRVEETRSAHSCLITNFLKVGDWQQCRFLINEGFEKHPIQYHKGLFLRLCETWPHDHHPDGPQWARGFLDTWKQDEIRYAHSSAGYSIDHTPSGLEYLGAAERIFEATDQKGFFETQIDHFRKQYIEEGFQTRAVWYLKDPVILSELTSVPDLSSWDWTPGSDTGAFSRCSGQISLHSTPYTGFACLTMPRMTHRVSGDFFLQVTINSGAEVQNDILDARQKAGTGLPLEEATGGGGLLIIHNQDNNLRLFAHIMEPGEVLFEVRKDRERYTLGRGMLEDAPIRLRLKKRGDSLKAFAGNEKGDWFFCGSIELPGWDQVEVGIYGECPVLLYSIIRRVETRFWDVCLEATPAPLPSRPQTDPLYPRPNIRLDPDLPEIVAHSAQFRQILQQVRQNVENDRPALITGETGTGKELIARAFHKLGPRVKGPFIPLNCAAIAPDLLERELFGHMRGAFTGAYESRGGLFEAADGGILFLDEIGEASPGLQARLLRVIEDEEVRRVGAQNSRKVDVRIVAATNRDLRSMAAQGEFRQDLFYRLAGIELALPPLHQRRNDIPPLTFYTLDAWTRRSESECPGITRSAMEQLSTWNWPGNVRELIQVVEQAAGLAAGEPIALEHLTLRPASVENLQNDEDDREKEIALISTALDATHGNVTTAARSLGISRNTLYRRMRRLGIKPRRN
jgi:transcriptional regulator with AAA-type ATPase domain/tetratricopeptide (TPR) repeat protein